MAAQTPGAQLICSSWLADRRNQDFVNAWMLTPPLTQSDSQYRRAAAMFLNLLETWQPEIDGSRIWNVEQFRALNAADRTRVVDAVAAARPPHALNGHMNGAIHRCLLEEPLRARDRFKGLDPVSRGICMLVDELDASPRARQRFVSCLKRMDRSPVNVRVGRETVQVKNLKQYWQLPSDEARQDVVDHLDAPTEHKTSFQNLASTLATQLQHDQSGTGELTSRLTALTLSSTRRRRPVRGTPRS